MTLYVDSEFTNTSEEKVGTVCAAVFSSTTKKIYKFWTHQDPAEQKRFKEFCLKHIDETWFSYAVTAEGRFWISSELDPVKFNWIDGFLEYRLLTNHNDRLAYGPQLVNGKVKNTRRPPPKWERTEEDSLASFKQTHSLAECTYKLTGKIRDTEHKDKMRDILISGDAVEIENNKTAIMDYCIEDTIFLPNIHKSMMGWYDKLLEKSELKTLPQEMLLRGKYAALTARMESYGYPINVEQTRNFSNSVAPILEECQREINELFPNIKPFRWNKTTGKFAWDQGVTKKWISENCDADRWMRTDKDSLSLSLEAFQRQFDFKHDYPKDNFGAQIVRYLKLKQNLNGFTVNPKKRSFWDSVGSDGRVRPYMNIYGAQSSRSQPGATGFLFLKPAWMRSLCQPKKGKAIASFDYGSQEFLVSALVSTDKNMLWAYESGDVYLAFGKLAGAIPENGTKKTHKFERDLFKATTLGVSYLMTKVGLAAKLTADTGKVVEEDEAQELIDLFYSSYPEFAEWQADAIDAYMNRKIKVSLPCIAEGTEVITSSGKKKIENILLGDLIWDGKEFVRHGGLVLRGEKTVISDKIETTISATKDHLILINGVWMPMLEAVEEGFLLRKSENYLEDGRLLSQNPNWGLEGLSFVGAYVVLKNSLESKLFKLEKLEPVLCALNLSTLENQSPATLAISLMTNIFEESGELAIPMQKLGVPFRKTTNSKIMELGEYDLPSTPFESSWNTLLRWMGIGRGTGHWTELRMMGTMKLETFESSLTKKTTITKNVYDILNCGPNNRFQAGNVVVHNCGWKMFPDNDNFRSAVNCRIQGMGACIMRKAVEFCYEAGLNVILTLHDAVYIEYDSDDLGAIDKLYDCMFRGFTHYFEDKKSASIIRLDGKAWGPDYSGKEELVTPNGLKIDCSEIFVDDRSVNEFNTFSKYFEESGANLL